MIAYYTNSSGVIVPTPEILEAVRDLRDGGTVFLIALGNDMIPFICDGSVELTVAPKHHLKVGQIVLAESDCGLVMHRIVSIDGETITLMADASTFGQEHCSAKDVVGVVVEMRDVVFHDKKRLSRAWLWRTLLPMRRHLLKIWSLFHRDNPPPVGL